MVNPLTKTHTFYHVTTKDRLESILKEGLRINSKPTWYSRPYPFICLGTVPFIDFLTDEYGVSPNAVLLEVDMKGFIEDEEERRAWNEREFDWRDWQVKIEHNIPPERVKLSEMPFKKMSRLADKWAEKYPEPKNR